MIEGWISVTDSKWFDLLANDFQHDEVNFWNPSGLRFSGTRGAPYFFKLKAPRHAIGGFGYVGYFCQLPEWQAWEFFGAKNGAHSSEELQKRLEGIRGRPTTNVGCTILLQATFFPRDMWVRAPSDWPANVQRYMRYDLSVGEGARVWRECIERAHLLGAALPLQQTPLPPPPPGPRYSDPVLVPLRLGQGAFRAAVADVYKKCAITGEGSLPVLEACHIKAYQHDGVHEISNGLLLRSDVHKLFDRGYLTVTPQLNVKVSPRLRQEYGNGKVYYALHEQPLRIFPGNPEFRPSPELLAWHNDNVYKG